MINTVFVLFQKIFINLKYYLILVILKFIFSIKLKLGVIVIYVLFLQCLHVVYASETLDFTRYNGYESPKIQDNSGCDIVEYETHKTVTMCNGTVFEIRPLTELEKTISPLSSYWEENQLITDKEVVTMTYYAPDLKPIDPIPDGNLTAEDAHYLKKVSPSTEVTPAPIPVPEKVVIFGSSTAQEILEDFAKIIQGCTKDDVALKALDYVRHLIPIDLWPKEEFELYSRHTPLNQFIDSLIIKDHPYSSEQKEMIISLKSALTVTKICLVNKIANKQLIELMYQDNIELFQENFVPKRIT